MEQLSERFEEGEGFQFADHTADIRMVVNAKSFTRLLKVAAEGMMSYLFGADRTPGPVVERLAIDIAADSPEEALAETLAKLLLRSESKSVVCTLLEAEYGNGRCRTKFRCQSATLQREIKAVTYSDLHVAIANTVSASITFDI